MKSKIRISALVTFALISFASCEHPVSPLYVDGALPPISVPWTSDQSLVCFGTSLTSGYMRKGPIGIPTTSPFDQRPPIPPFTVVGEQATADSTSYPALLSKKLQIRVYNQGYLGATTQRALNIVADSVFTKKPVLTLLEFGANDFLQELEIQDVQSRLERLVDTLHLFGSKVVLISFVYPEMISSIPPNHFLAGRKDDGREYLAMLRDVAQKKGILFVEGAMKGIYWNQDLMSDSMHPNREGYQIMQDNIYSALLFTFLKNNMVANAGAP